MLEAGKSLAILMFLAPMLTFCGGGGGSGSLDVSDAEDEDRAERLNSVTKSSNSRAPLRRAYLVRR